MKRSSLTLSLLAAAAVGLASAAAAPGATLVGQWQLTEGQSGATATDSSPSGDDGLYTGSTISRVENPDGIYAATDFEQSGGGAFVDMLNTPDNLRPIVNNLTITAWIKPDDTTGRERILSREAGGHGYGFGIDGNNLIYTTYGVADNTSANANLVAQGWRHIAVTHAPDGSIRYYVNGVLLTGTGNTDSSIGQPGNPGFEWDIAAGPSPAERFDGSLYDVRAYQGQLSASEIQNLATIPNLFAYHALDETVGTTSSDSSGYHAAGNLQGVYQNGVQINQASVSSAFGTAARFDGVNDEVFLGPNVPRQNQLQALTSNFTVAAWINPDDTNGIQRIFSQDSAFGNGWGFGLNGSQLRFTTYTVQDFDIAANIQAGVWTHVAVVFDENFDASFYVDGELIGTVLGSAAAKVGTANWFIGSTGRQEYYDGLIDELRIYDTALSASQIRKLTALIPTPAALPAGLALLGLAATRRARRRA